MGFTGVTYDFAAPALATTSIFFAPVPGTDTTGTLTAMTNNNVIVSPAQVGPVTFIDQSTGQVYNPTEWKYTASDGTVYIINATSGLQSVTDANGDTTTFSADSISSSTGSSLTITRDAQGRITSISDPTGGTLEYGYDFYGDLVTVTDPDGNVTRFTYDTDHTLLSVYDPLGRQGERVDYNSQGQVTEIIDPNGNVTMLNTDLGVRTETETNAVGGVTTEVFDADGNVVETIDPTGAVTNRTFDANGNLLTQTTYLANGTPLTTTYQYNSAGEMTEMIDPQGDVTKYTYDSAGNLLTTTDPMGNVTTTDYDSSGNPTESIDADGNVTTTTYGSTGNVTSVTDPSGNVTDLTTNPAGEILSAISGNGTSQSFTYNADGDTTSESSTYANPADPSTTETQTTTTAYDADGNATGTSSSSGQTQSVYDADGHLIKSIDAEGNVTSYLYDPAGNLIETTNPDGTVTREVYDALGRVIYEAQNYAPSGPAPEGTFTQYDGDGRATLVEQLANMVITITTTPSGASYSSFVSAGTVLSYNQSTYDAAGRLISSNDGTGTTTYEYNADGEETQVTGPDASVTQYQYDGDGDQTEMIASDGSVTKYQYDADGNLTKTIYPNGTSQVNVYDSNGQTVSQTDASGNTSTESYDSLGRMTGETLPMVANPSNGGAMDSPSYSFSYTAVNQVAGVTDPLGNVIQISYNSQGQRSAITMPGGQTETLSYTPDGQAAVSTDFNGAVTSYSYNTDGLISLKSYYADAAAFDANTPAYTISYTYTDQGLVATATDSRSGTTAYTYNSSGQVTEIDSPQGDVTYQYDPNTGQVSETTTADSRTLYAYNAQGELATVTLTEVGGQLLATPEVTTYTYDSNGDNTGVVLPNGSSTQTTYNASGDVTQVVNLNSSGQVLAQYDYTVNSAGQETSEVDTLRQPSGAVYKTQSTYTYDADGRLIQDQSVDLGGNDPSANYTDTYTYDLAGNRTKMATVTPTGTTTIDYTYNSDGELVQQVSSNGTVTTYAYNANGSQTEEWVNGQLVDLRTYGLDGSLATDTSYSTNSSGQTVVTLKQYTYDVSGNLVQTATTVTTGGVAAPTTVQNYVVDSNNPTGSSQVLETLNGSGQVQDTYMIGATVVGQVSSQTGVSVFQTDARNSTRVLTNSQGQVTAQYNFDAFGNAVGFNPATAATTILFTGQAYDAQLKAYNLRSRNYDPSTGRFDRMDTYGGDQNEPLTLNRYIYANDDPVNNVDPTGKLAFPVDLAIDGLIATGFAAEAGLPGSIAAALLVKTLLNPFEPLLTAILYRAPLAISLYNLGDALSDLASVLSGQLIGGILNLYDDVSNPPLIISGKQLVLNQGEQNFVQEAVLTGQQFLIDGLVTTIQAADEFQNIADQVKQTARNQAQALQNAIPSIINSIAIQFASAFIPGLGGLSVAMSALSSLQKIFQIVADVAQEIPVLQTIEEFFNYSYTINSPVTNQPLLEVTSQLTIQPDVVKMLGRFILGAFDPPGDINALTQIVDSLAATAENPTKEGLNPPINLINNFVNINLGHYLQSATLTVKTETLVQIPPLEGKLTSLNSALGELSQVAQSIKSQVTNIQNLIDTLESYVAQGVASLNQAQAVLDQVLDLGEVQDQEVQSTLDQINNSVLPDLQSIEQFLVSIEQVAQSPVKDLEDAVQTTEDYLSNDLVPDLSSLDSSLQSLISDGQTAENTLSTAISFLNGPVTSALQAVSAALSNIYQDLNSGQTGLTTLEQGVSAVEQALNQQTHVVLDETVDYGSTFGGIVSALPPNIANFFNTIGSEPIFSPILSPIFLDASPGNQRAPSDAPAALCRPTHGWRRYWPRPKAQWARLWAGICR